MRPAEARRSASIITSKFHQVVVGGCAGRLQHEHVLAADVLVQLDGNFTVTEAADVGLAQREVKTAGHLAGQFRVGVAGKHHQLCGHVATSCYSFNTPVRAAGRFFRRLCKPRTLHKLRGVARLGANEYGWGGRIRTYECRDQNPVPCHLATPQ
jgi:hypothetical protein